jgi:glycosyltransferase involved in cell wall biosynthesis
MNVVAIATAKNEIDIVEAFVRHTLTYANRLVVLDNGSTDGTLTVLRALAAEGLPLAIVEDPSLGNYQSQRMTYLMKAHAVEKYGADWVLALDADEFVAVPAGQPLADRTTSPKKPIALPWHSYVPEPDDDPAELNPAVRIRNRVKDDVATVKLLVPRRLAALPDAVLLQGSHELAVGKKPVAADRHEGGYLAHFPIRSPGQYLAKIVRNMLQYHTMPERDMLIGAHYLEPYGLLKRDPQAFLAGYATYARRYFFPQPIVDPPLATDPFPYRGGSLRYTPTVDDTTRGGLALLSYVEDLARKYGALSSCQSQGQLTALEKSVGAITELRIKLDSMANQLLYKERKIHDQHRQLMDQDRLRLERRILAKLRAGFHSLRAVAWRISAGRWFRTGFLRRTRTTARTDGWWSDRGIAHGS